MSMDSPKAVAQVAFPQPISRTLGPHTVAAERSKALGLALATAAMLWASYFPLNWGWLAWAGLVPFLCLMRSTIRTRWVYLCAWAAGLLCFGAALQWMRVADDRMYFTWLGLALYCSLFFLVGIWLLRWFDRRTRLPLVVTFPAVWTAVEYFRAHFATGFPWYFLAHTQHDFLPAIQVADLAGAYAVTFLVAAVNALVFEWLYVLRGFRKLFGLQRRAPATRVGLALQSLAVVFGLGAALGYGFWRLSQDDFAPGPRVALLQGNLPQRIRNDAAFNTEAAANKVFFHFQSLSDEAAAQRSKPDLIVWPETSFPNEWLDISSETPEDMVPADWRQESEGCRKLVRALARRWKTNVLLGVNRSSLEGDGQLHRYNSAILIDAKNGAAVRHYDKIHRVPFGEYVPLRHWLPWMDAFAPYDFDYSISPGEGFTRFPLGEYWFGAVICYEDTDPCLARQYVDPGDGDPAVDFLLNLSNDGWFDGTSEHEEHLAICRFRAIECRRAIARAVNMGISAVIDGNGRIVALPASTWGASKKIASVVTAIIPLDRRHSLYARWGDWLPRTCWIILGCGMLWSIVVPQHSSSMALQ